MPDEDENARDENRPGPEERRAGRAYSARFHLLDRQVVDGDDRPVCKVDDLELEPDPDGPRGSPPSSSDRPRSRRAWAGRRPGGSPRCSGA